VYRRKIRDLADLRQRIIEAVELITPHMLYTVENINFIKLLGTKT